MKFIHLSDLHLGKRLYGYSLIEDQEYILNQILKSIETEAPDGIIVAGDVYDKLTPSTEAVTLFDEFLSRLVKLTPHIFIISGNHDSAERLAFGGKIMDSVGVHLSPVYNGKVEPITLCDEYGEINVYLLPFIKPVNVRRCFPEAEIDSYTDAVRVAVENMNIDKSKRNIIVTHQFILGAELSESEEITVGGTDAVEAEVFADFDYVALGHIHSPQNIGSRKVRYCGTPLKYAFAEAKQRKAVTVVELGKKDELAVREIPLKPLRDVREIEGRFDELCNRDFSREYENDYIRIVLNDDNEITNAVSTLRLYYPLLMNLEYDFRRNYEKKEIHSVINVEKKTEFEMFSEFFVKQNETQMTDEQAVFLTGLINELKGE